MMNYIYENQNIKVFYIMLWLVFVILVVGLVVGLVYLDVDFVMKGFLVMFYLFSIIFCFILLKVICDCYEVDKFINKVEYVKIEKFLLEIQVVQ